MVHAEGLADEVAWLVYDHANGSGDAGGEPAFVTDFAYYSLGRLQRNENLHPVADLAMSFRIDDLHGRGLLWLQANDGRDGFRVQIDPGRETFAVYRVDPQTEKFAVWKGGKPVADGSGPLPGGLRGETIEASLMDRQFLLAIGSRTLFTEAIDTPGSPPASRQPLAIGAQGLGLAIDHVRVYRNIYYTNPPGARRHAAAWTLGPDEYFVLGDNSPISDDSRSWSENPLVCHKSLVGKPFLVIYPACEVSLGGWHIQVPAPARIRYIR